MKQLRDQEKITTEEPLKREEIALPKPFLEKMERMLGAEYEIFLDSYREARVQGLRVNTLKISVEELLQHSPWNLSPVPWTVDGFYYASEARPGKHPYHEAGLYYIQEPSAMAVASLAKPQPGDRVLDLCAAPGGKTTHLAAQMKGKGLLISNEIHPTRARILSSNVERMGVRNAVVTNETPAALAEYFPHFFDVILVDAPCSGEGMFRKDPEARGEWSLDNVELCAARQQKILNYAGQMLRPGGRLVYSTCTFSPEENEGVISAFLNTMSDFWIEPIQPKDGMKSGRPEWVKGGGRPETAGTIRFWPHQLRGEGHYIAILRRDGERSVIPTKPPNFLKETKHLADFFAFVKETLQEPLQGNFLMFGDQLYLVPDEMICMEGLKVLRPGWHLGTMKKNRFEPSHGLALTLTAKDVKHYCNLSSDAPEIMAYLRGETLPLEGDKGWYLIGVDGYSIGWGKLAGGLLKNHFPKGLRWKGRV